MRCLGEYADGGDRGIESRRRGTISNLTSTPAGRGRALALGFGRGVESGGVGVAVAVGVTPGTPALSSAPDPEALVLASSSTTRGAALLLFCGSVKTHSVPRLAQWLHIGRFSSHWGRLFSE